MTLVEDLSVVIDENKRGIQYGIYTAGVVGLAIALRSVKPFKKFSTPQSLPASFIKKHVILHGRVREIDPSGLLKIEHFPIWRLPGQHSSLLPVKIDSIKVMGLSVPWLQTIVKGEQVRFQPISIQDNSLSCIVMKEKKNVGIQLVSLGFASVQPIHLHLQDDKIYLKYYKELLTTEDKAEKKKLGIWAIKD